MTAPATIVAGNWDQTTHQELANITEQLKVLSARVANAPQLQQYLGSALFNLGCAWGYGQLAMTSPAAQSSSTHGAEA